MSNNNYKKSLKIYFSDFWPTFNKEDNFFTRLLSENFDLVLTPDKPDFLIYSVFGIEHNWFNCTKIFFTGENRRPNFKEADWAFTFDYLDHPRHYRLPLYALYDDPRKLLLDKDIDKIANEKTKFCNFVYSNPNCKERNLIFKKISKYKKVDSGGRIFNNIGGPVGDKLEFLRMYKFTIAYENNSYPGYQTEKIFEPMLVNSIPIYWGNPLVCNEFNTKSFVNRHDYNSDEEMLQKIIEIDSDADEYYKILKEPFFINNCLYPNVDSESIKSQFEKIIETNIVPISYSSNYTSSNSVVRNISRSYLKSTNYINIIMKKVSNFNFLKLQRILK